MNDNGEVIDSTEEYSLDKFAGVVPSIGDKFIDPGVEVGLDRSDPVNREIFTVIGRMFNIGDNGSYVGLIVDRRMGGPQDQVFI
jgi:hypothetical protein